MKRSKQNITLDEGQLSACAAQLLVCIEGRELAEIFSLHRDDDNGIEKVNLAAFDRNFPILYGIVEKYGKVEPPVVDWIIAMLKKADAMTFGSLWENCSSRYIANEAEKCYMLWAWSLRQFERSSEHSRSRGGHRRDQRPRSPSAGARGRFRRGGRNYC